MLDKKTVKIILSGGGTGGSATPLLAVRDLILNYELRSMNYEFFWIGTDSGPERGLVESSGIKFRSISSGKLRRYWSWQNFFDIFKIKIGFFQSFFVLLREKPDLVLSAGSFVSVPLVWAAWVLRIPVIIQQLDVRPGLANKLMAPFAKKVLVTFEKSLADYGKKAVLSGNPVRKEIVEVKISKREAVQKIGMRDSKPIALVMGGGTGAGAINELIIDNIASLTKFCQILHITGKGKVSEAMSVATEKFPGYKFFEFLDAFGLIKAYAAADIVITRAGIGSLTELSYLGKPSLIIPMPDSHQEENAAVFSSTESAVVLNQKTLTGEQLIDNIKKILQDENLRGKLKNNIKKIINTDCEEIIVETIKHSLKI